MMGQRPDEIRHAMHFTAEGLKPATPDNPVTKDDEGPMHHVQIDLPIAMGRNEVTMREWMACVNDGHCGGFVPSDVVGGRSVLGPDHPVTNINYADSLSYVAWINEKTGTNAYRLPTEAEWEYAARAGTTTRFAQGDELTSDQANFAGASTASFTNADRPDLLTRGVPVPVNELDASNAWGLRHMSGNLAEYTISCYTDRYLGWSTSHEWLEKSVWDEGCLPVLRGGAYSCPMECNRSAFRARYRNYEFRGDISGFRIVKELTGG